MVVLYLVLIVLFALYSYVLVDPNITLFNSPVWATFREWVVQIGYYHRELSSLFYISFIVFLFFFYLYFIKRADKINPFKIAVAIGVILLFSYPLLSHDLFNYMFDAKIFTYYGQNPYLTKPLDFPQDSWLRFMHWVHRPYPYGPVFLPLTFIPSFLSMGKLITSLFLFKLTFTGFYLAAVYLLQKMKKRWAVIFAFHPLVIVEGLINSHNDIVAVSLVVIGLYFVQKRKDMLGRILLLLSFGIKYTTLPFLLLTKKNPGINRIAVIGVVGILFYLTFRMEIQPWYFLTFFGFIPFFEEHVDFFKIFFFGLLLSYYPYIRLGEWDSVEKLQYKHIIILVFFIINIGTYLIFRLLYKRIYLQRRHE